VLNNPTTLTDPLGLYSRGECDIDPLSPDCGPPPCYTDDWNDCNSCDPILGCPGGYGGGHGGRGGRYGGGGGGGTVSSAPPAGQPPLRGGVGFISPNDAAVWEQIEQQYPWIVSTVWTCAFAPVCQEVLGTVAAGAAVGVAVGYGVAKLQNYIHQAKGGKQNVGHDYVREEARRLAAEEGISYCQALQQIYEAARLAGLSKKANDTKATEKEDGCRGH
jgi:hypothetical protein